MNTIRWRSLVVMALLLGGSGWSPAWAAKAKRRPPPKRPGLPDTPVEWLTMGEKAEQAGDIDRAIGYYRATVKGAKASPSAKSFAKAAKKAAFRLRKLDTLTPELQSRRKKAFREISTLGKRYHKKKAYEYAIDAYAVLCSLMPDSEKLAVRYYQNIIALDKARTLPQSSSRSLFNGYDFAGWEVRTGVWRVIDGNLVGLGGWIRLRDKPSSYKVTMTYRALPGAGSRPPAFWVHKDLGRLSGAEIALTGSEAGLAYGIKHNPKYIKTVKEKNGVTREVLRKKSRYKVDDWNKIVVSVSQHTFSVKLNGKTIYKTADEARTAGYDGEFARAFPGYLHIHGGTGLVISSITMKKK